MFSQHFDHRGDMSISRRRFVQAYMRLIGRLQGAHPTVGGCAGASLAVAMHHKIRA